MKKYIYDRLADGSFKPKIARTFPFDQTVEAYRYLESNEQIGKIVYHPVDLGFGLFRLLRRKSFRLMRTGKGCLSWCRHVFTEDVHQTLVWHTPLCRKGR